MQAFEALGLSQPVIEAVRALGYEQPTSIQEQAIPRLLKEDIDFIGLAQTGTGKTAAFGLPIIERIDETKPVTQALILAPTRELCLQITTELGLFSRFLSNIRTLAVYGGADIGKQIREAKKGAHIIVATPGRLRDLMRRKAVNLQTIRIAVLDEADEMLNMGFKEEIDEILSETPEEKMVWLFSATMPPEVRRISEDYMSDPFELSVGTKNASNADIDHQYVLVRPADRFAALCRFLDYSQNAYAIVFTRTRRDASELAEQLTRDGYNADALHGELSQAQRDRVMNRFRDQQLKVLIATDVAARGIDVSNISHIFHFNIPDDLDFYTHRAGRTGRAGQKGLSIILAHPKDRDVIRRLEKRLKTTFTAVGIPSGQEVFETRLMSFIQRVKDAEPHPALASTLPALMEELEGLSKEELVHKLVSMTMKPSMKAHLDSKNLNVKEKGARLAPGKSVDLFINVGSMDVTDKAGFLSFLCGKSGITGSDIGKIDLSAKHTFFQVDEQVAGKVIKVLDGTQYQGRPLRVNASTPSRRDKPGGGGKKGFARSKKHGKKAKFFSVK
jgi:ATP-dependent RNA helicase DeaD